jgi:hypothetical protein
MSTGGFPYPMALTSWHMLVSTIITQLIRLLFPSMMPSLGTVDMSLSKYARTILPIGVFFTMSLIFCNSAYIYLSVSFIQMIKAITPVLVLLESFAMRLESPNSSLLTIICMISVGVAVASYGEIHFVLRGFVFQLIGTASEATRLTLVNVLLSSKGMKLDPLSGLCLYAPLCTVLNGLACLFFEYGDMPVGTIANVGSGVLLANGLVAFSLNLAVVYLVKNAGSLVLTLGGIVKDILIIGVSCVLFGTRVSGVQCFGYFIAMTGLQLYKSFKSNGEKFQDGVWMGVRRTWLAAFLGPVPMDNDVRDGREGESV